MSSPVKRLVFGGEGGGNAVADVGLLVLRAFAGLAMAFAHGLGKLPPSDGFVGATEGLGFPVPEVFAWAAGLSEFVGGLLLAIGLATRPAALAVAFTMGVAAFGAHGADPFSDQEKALLFLAIAVCFVLTGAGRYSIDRLISGRPRRLYS
jgi:putative oxidoreductase